MRKALGTAVFSGMLGVTVFGVFFTPVFYAVLERLRDQSDVKGPGKKVCRGRIFSPRDYAMDVERWGFSEAVGNLEEQYG